MPGESRRRKKRITIADVAQRAGVSKSAVSHVVNGRDDISPAVRDRIRAAAAELGWQPAAAALALAGSRTRAIGYVVRRDTGQIRTDPFFGEVVAGVQPVLTQALYTLLVSVVSTVEEELIVYRRLVDAHQVDGFLLIDHRNDDPRYAVITESGLPAVAIGHPHQDTPFPAVTATPKAVAEAVTMLAGLGHRQLGYVAAEPEFLHSGLRQRQVQQAAETLSLPSVDTRHAVSTPEGAAAATTALLSRDPRPTAILYASDWLAMWGIDTVHNAGLRVPEDISVVGYDNIPSAAHFRPALTTIHADVDELASTAASMLLDLIEGRQTQNADTSAQLVVRESTGPAPA